MPAPSRTAADVISFFTELGLPVCDDWPAIKVKIDAQSKRKLREKNGTDPMLRFRADLWFGYASDAEKRRDDLLNIVRQMFNRLAKIALSGSAASGLKTVTPELLENLRHLALRECMADDTLADRFLRDFLAQENLTGNAAIPTPSVAVLRDFQAASEFGQVVLHWTNPAKDCDTIVIVREEEGWANQGPCEIYRGTDQRFIDRDVQPGVWYRYRAHAVYRGNEGSDSVQRALSLCEVRQASAVYREGRIDLTWERPNDDAAVVIFRRASQSAAVRFTSDGPEPADALTAEVYTGAADAWSDTQLVEGAKYYYLIVADFGVGLYGHGVEVLASVPQPVPAVARVMARHKFEADRDVVSIDWEPVKGVAGIRYTLVRREGSMAPAHADDGTVLLRDASQVSFRDEPRDAAGKRFVYAVFSGADGRTGRSGTASEPVDVLSEVKNLTTRAGDATVELFWQTPPGATSVVVRRSLNPPANCHEGTLVAVLAPGHARDAGQGLRNGRRYHYLVSCGYRPDGSAEIFSAGVAAHAVPDRLPDPVEELHCQVKGKEIALDWQAPPHGNVVLVRSTLSHGLPIGHRLRADEAASQLPGVRLVTENNARATDAQPDVNQPFYSAISIAGEFAVVGATVMIVVFPDVSDLRIAADETGILLRWTWPDNCNVVRIARRQDAWPEGPNDPRAVITSCTREEYRAHGNKVHDRIQQKRATFHYVVYAQPIGMAGQFFSPGQSAGCRAIAQWEQWMTVSYAFESGGKTGEEPSILWSWHVHNMPPSFKGLVLVANEERVPTHLEDGVIIGRWTRQPEHGPDEYNASISLRKIKKLGWTQFYCKAMLLDPAQGLTTLMIHPNPCVPIMANGRVHVPEPRRPTGKKQGTPYTVICPACFHKCSAKEILYTDRDRAATPRSATQSWLDWIRGRTPKPPVDERGRILNFKICPGCKEELPFTAGTQDSLVLGLIGAKYTGKSHYVASLIERLEGPAGHDIHASLLPVNDATTRRYTNDFHDPLYKHRQELPLTVGSPPPLIYDLTISGQLWHEEKNRSVTLSLYDTAGENFNDRDTVRRMVQYLSVASGVMLLVDPLQLDEVRDALKTTVRLPDREDPRAIIDRVLTELEEGKVLAHNGLLDVPVAVVLTKSDLLRDAGLIEPNRLWCTGKRHAGRFNLQYHYDMSGMMGEYVQRWHPALYNTVVRRFARHAFFGVSATGCASDKVKRYKFVSPWRVEDPLLWLLAEVGALPF